MPPTARAAGTAAGPVITWARTFPAVPAQVREARRFLAGVLDGRPAAGDALVCLSELASNAVVHSRSGQAGGTFTVRVRLDGQRLRVEVCDQGGPWHSPGSPRTDEPNGRGLLIVSQLATRWGCEGHSRTGWTVWFELGEGGSSAAEVNEGEQQTNPSGHGDEEEAADFPYVAATNGFVCPRSSTAHSDKRVMTLVRHMPDEMAIEHGGEPE